MKKQAFEPMTLQVDFGIKDILFVVGIFSEEALIVFLSACLGTLMELNGCGWKP